MGVKVKTPSPFVGAGSVATYTPNLSRLGNSIANSANTILQQRFQNRKESAIGEGDIAGSNFITYDENGNLENLKPLPEGDTYYEQALRESAKITYLSALRTDVENFGNKYLMENPYEPEIINEKMSILSDNYLAEMDESLIGDAQLIINSGTKKVLNKSSSNQILKKREDAIINSNIELNNIISESITTAETTNTPLDDVTMKLIRGLYETKKNSGEKGVNEIFINNEIKKIIEAHQLAKHLYGYNKIIHSFDPEDKKNNYKTLEKANKYKSDIRDSLTNNDLKKEWDTVTTNRYSNHITKLQKIEEEKNKGIRYTQTENYKKMYNEITIASAIDKSVLYIPVEERALFIEGLIEQLGEMGASQMWDSKYQGANVLNDTIEAGKFFQPIWENINIGKEGYTNFDMVNKAFPEVFSNVFDGKKNTENTKKFFLDKHIKELANIKINQMNDIKWKLTDSWIYVDATVGGEIDQVPSSNNFHYSLDATVVRKNLIEFVTKSQGSLEGADKKIQMSHINTMMNDWEAKKKNILEDINYGEEAIFNLQNNISLDEADTKTREYALNHIFNDDNINPATLTPDEVLLQANQIRIHKSSAGVYTSYLVGAKSLTPEALENTMPYLDRIFNNPDGTAIEVISKLLKKGVPIDYLQGYFNARQTGRQPDEAVAYALEVGTKENAQRLKTNFYKSIGGSVWGIGNDTDVKDDDSLRKHIENIFKERMYANSGMIDARVLFGYNDARFRPEAKMVNAFKDATGYSWDEVLHALPSEFFSNVVERAKIIYSLNPDNYNNLPDVMDDVVEDQIAQELDNWHPNVEIAAGGDYDEKPFLTWSKHSLMADAESLGGWGHSPYKLTKQLASIDIGMKLSLGEVALPSRIPVEREHLIGKQIDDEKHATSWLDVDFTVQYSRNDPNTGEKLYGVYYYDEYNRKIQIMKTNEDGTKSPLYYDYTYTNSTIYAAQELAYKDRTGDGPKNGIDKIWDQIVVSGLLGLGGKRNLKTNRDIQRFRLLVPDMFGKFFDGGDVQLNFKNMLRNQRNKDHKIKQRAWLKNTIGSYLDAGAGSISADRMNNLGLSNNLLRAQ